MVESANDPKKNSLFDRDLYQNMVFIASGNVVNRILYLVASSLKWTCDSSGGID